MTTGVMVEKEAQNINLLRIILLAILFIALLYRGTASLNHDSSWYLISTERFLHGARLYVDIIEVNPPLSFFLTVPPVFLAMKTGADATVLFVGWIFLLSFISLWLTWKLLRQLAHLSEIERHLFIILSAVALWLLPVGDFGQREHLAIIFAWPWFMIIALRYSGRRPSGSFAFFIGIWAFFGFALKPYFLIVPFALELLLLWKARRLSMLLRPETTALAIGLSAYLVVIYLFTPEYVNEIVPMAMAVYNQAYRISSFEIIILKGFTPIIFLILVFLLPVPQDVWRPLLYVFSVAAAGFEIAYLIQGKGWFYQLIPAWACAFVALVLSLSGYSSKSTKKTMGRRVLRKVSYVILVITSVLFLLSGIYLNPLMKDLRESGYIKKEDRSFLAISTNVSAGFPFVNEERLIWASRFPTLWLLPGVVRARHDLARDPESHDKRMIDRVEKYVRRAVVEDLEAFRPDIVAVFKRKRVPYMGDIEFDFLEWFKRDPAFVKAWQAYRPVGQSHFFVYYRRKEGQ